MKTARLRGTELERIAEVRERIAELRTLDAAHRGMLTPREYLEVLRRAIERTDDVVDLDNIAKHLQTIVKADDKDRVPALQCLTRIGEIQENRHLKALQEVGKLISRQSAGKREDAVPQVMIVNQGPTAIIERPAPKRLESDEKAGSIPSKPIRVEVPPPPAPSLILDDAGLDRPLLPLDNNGQEETAPDAPQETDNLTG